MIFSKILTQIGQSELGLYLVDRVDISSTWYKLGVRVGSRNRLCVLSGVVVVVGSYNDDLQLAPKFLLNYTLRSQCSDQWQYNDGSVRAITFWYVYVYLAGCWVNFLFLYKFLERQLLVICGRTMIYFHKLLLNSMGIPYHAINCDINIDEINYIVMSFEASSK